jgi:hypothetical protein
MADHPDGLVWRAESRVAMAVAVALALAGCDALPRFGGDGAGGEAAGAVPAAGTLASGDVEAPEVFHLEEAGLWDGRPSLGGIWVAHPDATNPERVRIVNRDNGQEVIGALFRRERDLPGPALQVSSDAAEVLGMLAGAPAQLTVTALRRTEAPAVESAPGEEPEGAAVPSPDAAAGEVPISDVAAAILRGATVAPADPAPAGKTDPSAEQSDVQASPGDPVRHPSEAGSLVRAAAVTGPTWGLPLGPAPIQAEQPALSQRAVAEGLADSYLVRS